VPVPIVNVKTGNFEPTSVQPLTCTTVNVNDDISHNSELVLLALMITHRVVVSVFNRRRPFVSSFSLTCTRLKELRCGSIFDKSQSSIGSIVPRIQTGHLRKDHGSIPGRCKKLMSYPKHPDHLWSLQAYCSVGTRALSPQCEAYHLCPFSAKVQNE
jgi:hypothetical protein